jgi:hypothetical protein
MIGRVAQPEQAVLRSNKKLVWNVVIKTTLSGRPSPSTSFLCLAAHSHLTWKCHPRAAANLVHIDHNGRDIVTAAGINGSLRQTSGSVRCTHCMVQHVDNLRSGQEIRDAVSGQHQAIGWPQSDS